MTAKTFLTIEEFWALPEAEITYELIDGQAIPKVLPLFFHSSNKSRFTAADWSFSTAKIRQLWIPYSLVWS